MSETSPNPAITGSLDPADWPEFRALAHRMLDVALDHAEGYRDRPVWTEVPGDVKEALVEPTPMEPQGTEKVCDDFVNLVLPLRDRKHPSPVLRLGARVWQSRRDHR